MSSKYPWAVQWWRGVSNQILHADASWSLSSSISASSYTAKTLNHIFRLSELHQCDQEIMSSGGAPTPAGTSVFTKHNWDMGMGYLWLNGWGIYHLMGGAFMAY